MSPTTDKKVDSGLSMHFWLSTVNLIWRWLSSFETYANDFQVINWLKKGDPLVTDACLTFHPVKADVQALTNIDKN